MEGNYTPNPDSPHQARKGWDVWDWCKANNVESEVVMGGHSTQILIPVTEDNAKLFNELL